MNNMEIIMSEAVASGYFEEAEVLRLVEEGEDIPFHSYSRWNKMGYKVKKNAVGWPCRIWRKKDKKSEVEEKEATEEERKRDFYLTKSFFFHISQCEKVGE